MKYLKITLLGSVLIAHLSFSAPKIIDKISAIVNNAVVLESDINNLMKIIKPNTNQENQNFPNDTVLRHQILEHLIIDQITLQIGQRMGIQISEEQIDQEIARKKNINPDFNPIHSYYNNANYFDYRNQIRKELLISEVQNKEVYRRISILPQEVEDLAKKISYQNSYKTQINLSQILVPLPKKPTVDQLQKAKNCAFSIFEKAHNSDNFDKLSVIFSSNHKNIKSIQMGWIYIQELPYNFIQALKIAKKGDILKPIRSDAGYHILKINDLKYQDQKILVTEFHVRHILLKPSIIMTDDQVYEKLKQISTNIKNGKISFTNAVKAFSQDPISVNKGGDLGWIADIYDPAFRNELTKMKNGQISSPIHSSFGWHIIELLDTRKIDKTDAVQKYQAYHILFNRKFSEELKKWMREQRESAYVKIM